jgi:hypothetical protein
MAYEPKQGQFTLFKNDRKEKETHPDYRGDGIDLEGRPIWVNSWMKEGKKGKFMSCSFQLKAAAPQKPKQEARQNENNPDDDLPW